MISKTQYPTGMKTGDWVGGLDRIKALTPPLNALYAPMESAFLGIGDHLIQAQAATRHMGETARDLADFLANDGVAACLASLDGTIAQVARLRNAGVSSSDVLEALRCFSATIGKSLTALQRVMGEINVLAINAKVEVAQMDTSSTNFSVFTHEISRLGGRGSRTVDELLAHLAELRAAADQASQLQQKFQTDHRHSLDELGTRLGQALASLKSRRAKGAKALDNLPQATALVGQCIARIVSGLQGSDITRQRLEHVETALANLDTLAHDAESAQGLVLVNAMAELQAVQLDHIGDEFAAKIGEIGDGLGDLSDRAATLGCEVEGIFSLPQGSAGATFLADMHQALDQAKSVLGQYADSVEATETSLSTVGQTAASMAQAMQAIADLDADMNLLGLNASIKCGNLGSKGRALNVVAQELRIYARQTRALAMDTAKAIANIRSVLGQLDGQNHSMDSGQLRQLHDGLEQSREQLDDIDAHAAAMLGRLTQSRQTLQDRIGQARTLLSVRDIFAQTIDHCVDDMRMVRDCCHPGLPHEQLRQARRELLSFLEDHYTMESERELHEFLLDGNPPSQFQPPKATPPYPVPLGGPVDIGDLLF